MIKSRSIKHRENDNLYVIYASLISQSLQFIRNWLKSFMLLHKNIMIEKGKFHLDSKKLSYKQWLEAIEDGRKGDILVLYGLSVLTEVHTYVHLHNNQFWSTLKKVPESHSETLKMCAKHLLYLGRGMFIELTPRPSLDTLPKALSKAKISEIDEAAGTQPLNLLEEKRKTATCTRTASASAGSTVDLQNKTKAMSSPPPQIPLDLSKPSPSSRSLNLEAPHQTVQILDLSMHTDPPQHEVDKPSTVAPNKLLLKPVVKLE